MFSTRRVLTGFSVFFFTVSPESVIHFAVCYLRFFFFYGLVTFCHLMRDTKSASIDDVVEEVDQVGAVGVRARVIGDEESRSHHRDRCRRRRRRELKWHLSNNNNNNAPLRAVARRHYHWQSSESQVRTELRMYYVRSLNPMREKRACARTKNCNCCGMRIATRKCIKVP